MTCGTVAHVRQPYQEKATISSRPQYPEHPFPLDLHWTCILLQTAEFDGAVVIYEDRALRLGLQYRGLLCGKKHISCKVAVGNSVKRSPEST